MGPRRGRRTNGKKHPNLERMERAAGVKALGYGWADITRLLKIPHQTLMRWAKDATFQALVTEAKAEEVHLQRLARLVTVRQLEAGLNAKYSKEDAARAADRVMTPIPGQEGEYPAGGAAGGWYVEYPPRDQGLESKPTQEVLLAPPAPPPPPEAPGPGKKRRKPPPGSAPKRRRVVGPDE